MLDEKYVPIVGDTLYYVNDVEERKILKGTVTRVFLSDVIFHHTSSSKDDLYLSRWNRFVFNNKHVLVEKIFTELFTN